ncbi:MAG: type II toxin-antitoxin system prevent-host-death family antitoxin [Acidimicrobiia bacterium]|nr:type II toxin-antitoxin system prevent-host-death family antitoxin [Acidimicrobiia bacterium]
MTIDQHISDYGKQSRMVTAWEFKTRCLQLIREVGETGQEIIVTRHKKPVARLVPVQKEFIALSGIDKGRLKIYGDIVASVWDDELFDMEDNPEKVLDPAAWYERHDNG